MLLQTERAIRFHYSNCSALNADFDGDEINIHLLQDEPSRAEAMTIMDADKQFYVPTDGYGIPGLAHCGVAGWVVQRPMD